MSPIEIGASRPVGPVQVSTAKTAKASGAAGTVAVESSSEASASAAAAQVERSAALDGGTSAPVDTNRVSEIRRAIETGSYPVIPAKIADAMIAAGMLLRTPQ